MIDLVLASVLSVFVVAQAPAEAPPAALVDPTPSLYSPTDDFGPDLKAWLDATKLQNHDAAATALANLQRRRAERNLTTLDDVAGAISGRGEVRASEGSRTESVDAFDAAIRFAPDSAAARVRKATAEGSAGNAWSALRLAWASPLEQGRLRSAVLLSLLVICALFTAGFSFGLLLRYAAIFSHDVSEGLPASLKALSLFMAVLFLALPLAGFLGWGYLPFWWITLFFIFESRAEKTVTLVLLSALAVSSLALPMIEHQRAVETSRNARPLYLVATGGISVDAESLVEERLAQDPADRDWSLLSASLSRRAGRFDDATAALLAGANADPRFAHNAAALEFNQGNFAAALPVFARASEASLSVRDKATAFYNLSLAQANTLAFDPSKESRKKAAALDAAAVARFDQLFSFESDGSKLQAPPDIVPALPQILGAAIPAPTFTVEDSVSRLTIIAIAFLLFIPAVVRFRGAQSFSKQCPKCGTTFCWLCQTRSTSQDVCSQCHYLFVVKRGIPPAAKAAKNQEISRYASTRDLLHRVASFVAPGAGHLSVGHFTFGLPLLLVWALSAGAVIAVHYFVPRLVASSPLGSALTTGFGLLAVLTYVLAQVVKPRKPAVAAPPPRRSSREEAKA